MVVFACAKQYIFVLIYFMHSSSHAFIPNTYITPFPLTPGNNSYHFFLNYSIRLVCGYFNTFKYWKITMMSNKIYHPHTLPFIPQKTFSPHNKHTHTHVG